MGHTAAKLRRDMWRIRRLRGKTLSLVVVSQFVRFVSNNCSYYDIIYRMFKYFNVSTFSISELVIRISQKKVTTINVHFMGF